MTEQKTSKELDPEAAAAELDVDSIVPGGAQGGVIARARRKGMEAAKPAVARSRARVRLMFQAVESDDGEAA